MHDDLAKLVQEMASKLMGGEAGQAPPGEAQTELRTELEQARAEGQLQRAWALCQKLKEQAPDDVAVSQVCAEIQAEIQEREVEQLVATAVAYADDGDAELAGKILAKIERLAPESPQLADLRKRLGVDRSRSAAEHHTSAARELLVEGKLEEARAAAEAALELDPGHAQARQIRDQTARILESRQEERSGPSPTHEVPPPSASPPPPSRPSPPPPKPEAPPPPPSLPPPLPPIPGPAATAASQPTQEPERQQLPPLPPVPSVLPAAPPPPPPAAAPSGHEPPKASTTPKPSVEEKKTPAPAPPPEPRAERPGAEAEALATAAINHFVQNENEKARRAAERALDLDPNHKGARDLLTLLGSLR
jgi:tetratricopeptide (TPR) repeat protein